MRISVFAAIIVTLSGSLWAAPKIQPLNVKTGLWQTTMTMTRAGEMPLPSNMLSRLTPEQRARFEARIKADSVGTHTRTYKGCLTQEQLANPNFTKDEQCTWTTLQSNSTRIKGAVSCNYKDSSMKLHGSGEFVALDREHVKGSVHMTARGSGRTMDTTSDFSSKWLGPRCGNVN